MRPNRFLQAKTRPLRIALSCTAQFPDPEQVYAYGEFKLFRDALNAEVVVPHSQVAAGARLPQGCGWLDGKSAYIRPNHDVHRADYAHFRRTMPERFTATMDKLAAAIGCSRADLDERFEVHHACTYARLVRALDVDCIHTWYNYDQSLNAIVAAELLGIPRGITLCDGFEVEEWDLKIPKLHLETADWIVATSDGVQSMVGQLGGDAASSKCFRNDDRAPAELATRVRRAIDAADPAPGGVDAAYHESDERSRSLDSGAVPFVLLATERTGSNLLLEVLALESAHELFNPDYKEDRFIPIFNQDLHRDEGLLRLRDEDKPALIDRVLQIGKDAGFDAMGFKLMYFHGDVDYDVTDYLLNSRDFRVFHVRRDNRLSRFVSFERAKLSGSWYKTRRMSGEGGPKQAVALDVQEMLADFLEQELLEEKYAALFRHHAMLDVDYETFSADFDKTRRDGRRLLGIELPKAPVRTRKTGKRTMREMIANFDEVAATLRGTRFERHLEENA